VWQCLRMRELQWGLWQVLDDSRTQKTSHTEGKSSPDIDSKTEFRILGIQHRDGVLRREVIMPVMARWLRSPLFLKLESRLIYGRAAKIKDAIALLTGIAQTVPVEPHVRL
jgi:hypothetical protein